MNTLNEEEEELNCVIIFLGKTISGSLLMQMTRSWDKKKLFKAKLNKEREEDISSLKSWVRMFVEIIENIHQYSIDVPANIFEFLYWNILREFQKLSKIMTKSHLSLGPRSLFLFPD